MLISIITPTFNSAATLKACIETVANQTYRPIEHIFVDGNSQDQTIEIIKEAQTRYSHIRFISEKDAGVYDAMNKGLRLAKGDYIYFLGSDDRLFNTAVFQDLFGNMSEPGKAVIHGDVKIVGANMGQVKEGDLYGGVFDLSKLVSKNICHQAVFYPRSVVLALGEYNIRYRVSADWDYNLRAFSKMPFEYKRVTVAEYNTTGFSSTRDDLEFIYHYADDLEKLFGRSIFNRCFKGAYEFFGVAGFMRLRLRKLSGLRYIAAACFHSPSYFAEVFNTLLRWLKIQRRTQP